MSTKGRRFPPVVLKEAEVRALMAGCSKRAPTGVRNRALIALLWRSGLRISEALDLVPGDVDGVQIRVNEGKGGKFRVVGMSEEASALVERWLAVRSQRGITGRQKLFCTLSGGRLSDRYVRTALRRLARKVEVEQRVHPHAFRHTLANELAKEQVDVVTIQHVLGHASLDGTAHYLQRIAPHELVAMMGRRG
jgi:site-specific recombinase XerD